MILVFLYDVGKNRNGKNVAYYICFVLLWLYSGLRYRVGTDSFMYESMFEYIPTIGKLRASHFMILYQIEPLWIILNSLIKTIWNSFVALELFCSFVLNYSYFYFIKKNTGYIFTAILVFYLIDYLILNCEFMRQSTAVALYMIFVFPQYVKKRYLLWFCGTGVLCFMHNTMFFCFLIPLVDYINISNRKAIFCILLFSIIISNIDVFKILTELSTMFSSASYKIKAYSSDAHATIYTVNFIISKFYVLFLLIYLLCLKVKFKYRNIIILYVFSVLLTSINDIFARLQYVVFYYYLLLYTTCIADTLLKKRQSLKAVLIFIATLIPTVVMLMHQYENGLYNYQKYFPYYSYLHPQKDRQREQLKTYDSFQKMLESR